MVVKLIKEKSLKMGKLLNHDNVINLDHHFAHIS
jgi:hypothetical protein